MVDNILSSVLVSTIVFKIFLLGISTICKNISIVLPVGPEPAGASRQATISPEEQAVKSPSIQPLLTDFCSLLTQNATLCNLLQTIVHKEEEQLAVDCLKIIHSSVHMIHSQLSFKFKILAEQPEGPLPIPIISLHTRLWHQLSFPHCMPANTCNYYPCRGSNPITSTIPSVNYLQLTNKH